MKRILFFLTLSFAFILNSTKGQEFIIVADSVVCSIGSMAYVDINSGSENPNINHIAGSIAWDPNVLSFEAITYFGVLYNPAMDIGDFDLSLVAEGKLSFEWESALTVGPTIENFQTLFTIKFESLGEYEDFSPVTFSNDPLPLYWSNGFGEEGVFETISGGVSVLVDYYSCFDPNSWSTFSNNSNAAVWHVALDEISFWGDNDGDGNGIPGLHCYGPQGNISHCFTPPNEGYLSFKWEYDNEVGNFESETFGYCINGISTQLNSNDPLPFGTIKSEESIYLSAYDFFCFVLSSENGDLEISPEVQISDLHFELCGEPSLRADLLVEYCSETGTANLIAQAQYGIEPYSYVWDIDSLTGSTQENMPLGEYCVTVIDALMDSIVVCDSIVPYENILSYNQPLCQTGNLVTDPSFEDWTPNVSIVFDNLAELNQWWAINGSPDYHHQDHQLGSNLTSLEDCPLGNGQTQCGTPVEGKAVLGIYKANGANGTKEWAATKLREPMKAGNQYQVSFQIQNKKDNPDFIAETSNWGVFFSTNSSPLFNPNTLDFDTVACEFVMMEEMLDGNDWNYVEWEYTPQHDYKYIYVGYMGNVSDATENIWSTGSSIGFYTWFEEIQVIELEDNNLNIEDEYAVICIGDSLLLTANEDVPFQWTWNNGNNTSTDPNFWVNPNETTTYVLEYFTDPCPFIDSIQVIVADCLCPLNTDIESSVEDNSLCPELALGNGKITLSIDGSINDYTFIWNDTKNQTSSIASNLKAGDYRCLILDENNCIDTVDAVIEEPLVASVTYSFQNESCAMCTDGSITIDNIEGSGPFDIMWSTGENENSIIDLDAGIYAVAVTDQFNCTYTSYIDINTVNVGVEEYEDFAAVNIFPNPANDIINIESSFNQNREYSISISNPLGQVIFNNSSKTGTEIREQINLSHLQKGLYYITFNIDGQRMTKKFVLE